MPRFYPASDRATIEHVVLNRDGTPNGESTSVFTGLVEGLGRVERVIAENAGCRLEISCPGLPEGGQLRLGESVAVNGCCLTAVAVASDQFEVQAGPETLARTNLGLNAQVIASTSSGPSKSAIVSEVILSQGISTQPPSSASGDRRGNGSSSPSGSSPPGHRFWSPKGRSPSMESASPWLTSGPTRSRSC